MHRFPLALVSLALCAAPLAAHPAAPGDPVVALRRSSPVVLDGRLEEPDWDLAPLHDGFFQMFPEEGAPPSERTEVRVLYDDRALYVGVVARDSRPAEVSRPLGRRDGAPPSDSVAVFVDSTRGRRSAQVFELNAAGVQTDGLLFEDDTFSTEWDAVWDGATAAIADGWSAEFRIPLSALRFSAHDALGFGFGVRRAIARTHETLLSVPIPRSARGQVARLGELVGLKGLEPVRAIELAPYLAARASLAPRASDGDPPTPRRLEPVSDVGLDLRTSLGRGLAVQATLNPDFGQVEADQIVLNLSNIETFFPEKRPFFTQGMDLFQPVAPPGRPSPQQLFYSRRIGLDAPILAAAKLSGAVSDDLQIGLVEAFVTGAGAGGDVDDPPRGFRFESSQPLRFGSRAALPALAPAPRNFAAAVARWRPSAQAMLGATVTSSLLSGPACTAAEAAEPDDDLRLRRCEAITGNAAGLDFSVRSRDGAWFALGQLSGSQARGGAPTRVLRHGTAISRGDLGFGAHAAAGRQGGEPWRFEAHWEYESPKLDLNAAGFQQTQNEQLGRVILRYVRPNGGGPFHTYAVHLGAMTRFTTDGRGLHRGSQLFFNSEVQLQGFQWIGCNGFLDSTRWDVREIDRSDLARHAEPDLAQQRAASAGGDCWFSTDASRPLFVEGWAGAGSSFPAGPLAPLSWGGTGGRVVLRPHPRVETRLDGRLEWNRWRARWVETRTDGAGEPASFVFADLTAPALSLTLRQQLVITRRLTLQAYAQLFASYERYGPFYEAARGDGRVAFSDLVPIPRPGTGDAASPESRTTVLNVNVVLRWEYRLGSTFFAVYTRGQEEQEWQGPGMPPFTLRPHGLARGPTEDTLLFKWSHYWGG